MCSLSHFHKEPTRWVLFSPHLQLRGLSHRPVESLGFGKLVRGSEGGPHWIITLWNNTFSKRNWYQWSRNNARTQYRDLGSEMENTRWPGSPVKTTWSEGTWDKLTAKMSPPLHSLLKNAEVADFIIFLITCLNYWPECTDDQSLTLIQFS